MSFDMKRLYFIILILVLGINNSYSQTGALVGEARDAKTNERLPGVNVLLQDSIGTVTSDQGIYQFLNLNEGIYKVSFHFVGYKTVTMEGLTIKNGVVLYKTALMEESLSQLPIMVV